MSRTDCERRRRMLAIHPTVTPLEPRNAVTPIFATATGMGVVGGTHASNYGGG